MHDRCRGHPLAAPEGEGWNLFLRVRGPTAHAVGYWLTALRAWTGTCCRRWGRRRYSLTPWGGLLGNGPPGLEGHALPAVIDRRYRKRSGRGKIQSVPAGSFRIMMSRNQIFTPGSPFRSVPCSEICPEWYLLYPGIRTNLV